MLRDHLIRRHGGFFRPQAMGYTYDLAQAGLFTKEEAEAYLDVEGLTIHPLSEYASKLDADIKLREADLFVLRALRDSLSAPRNRANFAPAQNSLGGESGEST